MAAIDKTYLKRWEDYTALRSWLYSINKVTDDFGNTFRPIDFFWDEWTEEGFNECIQRELKRVEKSYSKGSYKWHLDEGLMTQEEYDNFIPFDHISGIPIWNAPTFFDVWLIRNCPFDFIQDRLKEQYGESYNPIKYKSYNFDFYERNGLGKAIKVGAFPVLPRSKVIGTSITIHTEEDIWWYYKDNDYWACLEDLSHNTGNRCSHYWAQRYLTPKSIFRKLQKWDLLENTIVTIDYHYSHKVRGDIAEFDLVIRKRK